MGKSQKGRGNLKRRIKSVREKKKEEEEKEEDEEEETGESEIWRGGDLALETWSGTHQPPRGLFSGTHQPPKGQVRSPKGA